MRRAHCGSWHVAAGSIALRLGLSVPALVASSLLWSTEVSSQKSPAVCWTPEALAYRAGDERIRREIKGAFVQPPTRAAARYAPVPHDRRQVIRRVNLPAGTRLVALTFDLCEQPHEIAGYQGQTVDYLRAHNIKATFFAGGKWMLTHRERTQQLMTDPLFELGSHTWEHRNLRLLVGSSLTNEIAHAQVAYEQVREELAGKACLAADGLAMADRMAPTRLSLFRFPFGACNQQALEAVGQMGLRAIQWDVSSGDPWRGQSPAQMARVVLAQAKPGSIILFHANGRGWNTESALPIIVRELTSRGFGFVKLSELLELGEPVYASTCYDSRPGDTDRYDGLARYLATHQLRGRQEVISGARGVEGNRAPFQTRRPAALPDFTTEIGKGNAW